MSFVSRLDRFGAIDSTQRVVREWLNEGTPEVCVAVADEQLGGRGRNDRSWSAPSGAALLVSAGFTPTPVPPPQGWRLGATSALAMLDAAEEVAGLRDGTLWLKWPNDLVAEGADGRLLKVAGVLGETSIDRARLTGAVIGVGVNCDWERTRFPDELAHAMTSLHEVSGGRPVDRDVLLEAWLHRLEPRTEALYGGAFDAGAWSVRQRTTGRQVELELGDGRIEGRATGVDPLTGALLVEVDGRPTAIDSGEVVRCRVMQPLGNRQSPGTQDMPGM